jgi:adenosylcobyric acid synthase
MIKAPKPKRGLSSNPACPVGPMVNKFRGDLSLFADGVQILEEKGAVPVLGVVPYSRYFNLPDDDAVAVENSLSAKV